MSLCSDPDVAARVYHLQLELGPICYLSMEDQVVSLQSGKLNTKERIKKEAAVATLSTVMGHLNNLMSLRVEISCPYYEYFAKVNPPFFRIGWSCFCRTLQKLELRVPIESMDAILPDLTASGGKVENLEELSLDIMRATPSSTESTIIMLETIRPFLDVHRHSLKSLTIDALENTNLAPILDSVNFPSLAHFRLVQPYFQKWSADYTGVREFLTNHCSHLISFEIAVGFPAVDDGLYLSDSEPIFAQECFRVPLPNLQNLAVLYEFDDNPMTARIRDSVIDYVHQFRASLISLSLASRLTAKSAKRFVAGFRSGTLLQQLQISVDVLDTELFTALSKRSPLLQSLVLNYSDFAPNVSLLCSCVSHLYANGIIVFRRDIYAGYFTLEASESRHFLESDVQTVETQTSQELRR